MEKTLTAKFICHSGNNVYLIKPTLYKVEDIWYINTEYGYKLHKALGTQMQIRPKKGDVWHHTKSKRTFTLGEFEGFLTFCADLIDNETGKPVAKVFYEEY